MRKGQLERRILGRQNFPGTLWVQVREIAPEEHEATGYMYGGQ